MIDPGFYWYTSTEGGDRTIIELHADGYVSELGYGSNPTLNALLLFGSLGPRIVNPKKGCPPPTVPLCIIPGATGVSSHVH